MRGNLTRTSAVSKRSSRFGGDAAFAARLSFVTPTLLRHGAGFHRLDLHRAAALAFTSLQNVV